MSSPSPLAPQTLLAEAAWLRSLATRLAGDSAAGQDLEQEVWQAALQHPPRTDRALRPWLRGVASRLAALARRGARRRRLREQRVAREPVAPSAADLVQQVELQQRVLSAVQALPVPMRDVVLLRHCEDLPPREIARRLGVPVATVHTRLQRAVARLRDALDAEFGDRRRWAVAALALARPRAAAGAGLLASLVQTAVVLMSTKKFLVATAVLTALAAIPAVWVLRHAGAPPPPDFSRSTPVASLFERSAAVASEARVGPDRTTAPSPTAGNGFTGTVVERDGTPIARAVVRLWPFWQHRHRLAQGQVAWNDVEQVTGDDGTFAFPRVGEATIRLVVEHERYVSLQERIECRAGVAAMLVMLPTHEVPLVVEAVDRTTRSPVQLFTVSGVTWWRSDGAREGAPDRSLRAPDHADGLDGVFRGTLRFVEGLPVDLQLGALGHGCGEWGDGGDDGQRRTLMPVPGQPVHLHVEFDIGAAERLATRVQRGRVVAASDGAPIAGAALVMLDGDRSRRAMHSGADGTFVIALPRNGHAGVLHVEHRDHQGQAVATQPERELELRLVPRAMFRCRVVDRDGRPLPDTPILFQATGVDPKPWTHLGGRIHHERLRTDKNGSFTRSGLLAGRYLVFVLANDRDPDERALTNCSYQVEPGADVDVVLAVEPPDTVRVIGAIAGARPGVVPAFVAHAGNQGWVQARAVGAGYDAGGLRRGDYLVALVPEDDGDRGAINVLPHVRIDGFGSRVLDLLVPQGIVRGRVVMATRRTALRVVALPVLPPDGPAAALVASEKFRSVMARDVAPEGSFTLEHIADGDYRLELLDGARTVASRVVRVRGDANVGDWFVEG